MIRSKLPSLFTSAHVIPQIQDNWLLEGSFITVKFPSPSLTAMMDSEMTDFFMMEFSKISFGNNSDMVFLEYSEAFRFCFLRPPFVWLNPFSGGEDNPCHQNFALVFVQWYHCHQNH